MKDNDKVSAAPCKLSPPVIVKNPLYQPREIRVRHPQLDDQYSREGGDPCRHQF
jgi:hypothetical protein